MAARPTKPTTAVPARALTAPFAIVAARLPAFGGEFWLVELERGCCEVADRRLPAERDAVRRPPELDDRFAAGEFDDRFAAVELDDRFAAVVRELTRLLLEPEFVRDFLVVVATGPSVDWGTRIGYPGKGAR